MWNALCFLLSDLTCHFFQSAGCSKTITEGLCTAEEVHLKTHIFHFWSVDGLNYKWQVSVVSPALPHTFFNSFQGKHALWKLHVNECWVLLRQVFVIRTSLILEPFLKHNGSVYEWLLFLLLFNVHQGMYFLKMWISLLP